MTNRVKGWIVGAGIAFMTATACNAGFLHKAYEGEFCAHNHKYVVDSAGSIIIQTQESTSGLMYVNGMLQSAGLAWQTDITFNNLSDLDNVISDLQKMSKQLHDAYGDDYKSSDCDSGCK